MKGFGTAEATATQSTTAPTINQQLSMKLFRRRLYTNKTARGVRACSIKELRARASRVATRSVPPPSPSPSPSPSPDGDSSDSDESSDNIPYTVSHTMFTKEAVYEALCRAGYLDYLKSHMGGDRNDKSAARGLLFTTNFLMWSHLNVLGTYLYPDYASQWLNEVITTHYDVLMRYAIHLQENRLRKPSTIKNHVFEVMAACKWYCLMSAEGRSSAPQNALVAISYIASAVNKVERKREKKHRCELTMAGKANLRRWPIGGLQQLQRAVHDRFEWASNLHTDRLLEKDEYICFMQLMFAAFYVCGVQGRVSGISSLKYEQGLELLQNGHAFSTAFKTCSAWSYQPVMLTAVTARLLRMYIDWIRKQRQLQPPAPQDNLWLSYNGKVETRLGHLVVQFFRKTLDLHITTNTIRSLVETTMHDAHSKGDITFDQQQSVHAINGHCSKVAQDYYTLQDRASEVASARNALERISKDAPIKGSETELNYNNTTWLKTDVLQARDWGKMHPDYGKDGRRAKWSKEELDYVGRFCEDRLARYPECNNVVALCLQHIQKDDSATPIFHRIHVMDSGRLRCGYRQYCLNKLRRDEDNSILFDENFFF